MKKEFENINMCDEFEVRDRLIDIRKDINTMGELISFIELVKDECNTDYGTAPRAIAQAASATAWYLAKEMGITGFQAGFVMWDFIRNWNYTNNKCGMRIVDYDDMLYPQYDYKFEKVISQDTWEVLQKEAKERLETIPNAHVRVKEHWQSIVDGKVPFGYEVKGE